MIRTIATDAVAGRAVAPEALSVLCAVTSGPATIEAVRQAAALAAGGSLTIVDASPPGDRDDAHLTAACRVASRHGVDAEIHQVRAQATPTLLLLAAEHDLLVVSADRNDALGDALPRAVVQQAPIPVLLARPHPDGAPVTARILVATDGSPEAQAALAVGHEIAGRHGSGLAVVSPAPGPASGHVGLVLRDLTRSADPDATALASEVSIPDAIAQAARRYDATLVVVGSRGLSGVAALASVSAGVATTADCSVLVLRPKAGAPLLSGLYRAITRSPPDDDRAPRP
jgi:nucleotide-binding universal stress UspA family protein